MGKRRSRTSGNRKLNISAGVWVVALVLVILVLATSVLLSSFIKRYVAGEKNVIEVLVDAGEIRDKYDDDTLPTGAVPGIGRDDGQGAQWETQTSVDLFKNTYTDPDGNVRVESANGDKLIAPGTTNDYEFTIKNTGNISLDYTISLTGTFEVAGEFLPFYVRMRCGDEWLVGDENGWVHVEELGDRAISRTLPRAKSDTFVFQWQWPYDSDAEGAELIGKLNEAILSADQNDTKLGNLAADMGTDFSLNITTSAGVTPGAEPTFGDGTRVLYELILVVVMAGLIITCFIFLILFIFNRKICFVALITPSLRTRTRLDKKEREIVGKHVIYPRVGFGPHHFAVSDNNCKFKLKRGDVETGVRFEFDGECTNIIVDRSIRAVQVQFVRHFHGSKNATIDSKSWAAIDRKHNVYIPGSMIPADPETKTNSTPEGLKVSKWGKYSF